MALRKDTKRKKHPVLYCDEAKHMKDHLLNGKKQVFIINLSHGIYCLDRVILFFALNT